jgi:chromosome segregation ATPase
MISYEEETALNSEENEDQIRNIQHNSTSLEEKSSMDIIQQLRKENQSLVASNQENVKQIALLEDEVATKQSMVDKMTDYIDEFSASCKEMMQENAALSEQQDVLNATIQVLESNNKNLVGEVEQLQSSMQEIITMNESLQLRNDDVTAANNTFVKINSKSEDEIADLLDVLERMTKTLEDERVSYEDEIKELTALLDKEKDDKNAIVSLLQEKNITNLDHAKNDGLEAEVKSLFSRIKDNLQQIAVLEDDVAAKKSMIDTKSKDVESLNLMCKKNASENADLKKQLKLSDAESDRIKKTVQDLESNVNNYFFEVENLSSSHEVADTQTRHYRLVSWSRKLSTTNLTK